jgi:hypothetical protein
MYGRRPVVFGVPLTPTKHYDNLKSTIEGKNNILRQFLPENPIHTGTTRTVFEGKKVAKKDPTTDLSLKAGLMYNAAIERAQEKADNDSQVGIQMRMKRKSGLASGYNIPKQYSEQAKLRKNQYM